MLNFEEEKKKVEASSSVEYTIQEFNPFKPVVEEVKKKPQQSVRAMILAEYGGLESNIPVGCSYWIGKQ